MPETHPLYKTGMVFGVFDGLHPGHQHFLTEAARHCQKLIVIVAHPDIVLALKNHLPHRDLQERIATITSHNSSWEVIAGDQKIGTWSALKKYQPDVVLLGYDQITLGQELVKMQIPHFFITPHHPDKYTSSLLNTSPLESATSK